MANNNKATSERIWSLFCITYVVMGIFTYGNAYNYFDRNCKNSEGGACPIAAMGFSTVPAIGWPIYWSIFLQDKGN